MSYIAIIAYNDPTHPSAVLRALRDRLPPKELPVLLKLMVYNGVFCKANNLP